jgi:hypothetical protein
MKSSSWRFIRAAVVAAGLTTFLTCVSPLPSVAAAEWTWPVRGRVITSYANDNGRPYAGGMHRGIDIAAPVGTAVVAAASGKVTYAAPLGSSGLTVAMRTSDARYLTSYLHLSRITVEKGVDVGAGDEIGEVGTSGTRSASEPHLHFGVRLVDSDRFYVDPLTLLRALEVPTRDPTPGPLTASAPVRAEPEPAPVPHMRGLPAPARRPAATVPPFPRPLPIPAARAAPVRRPAELRPLPVMGRSAPAWSRGGAPLELRAERGRAPAARVAPATMPVFGARSAARSAHAGLRSRLRELARPPAPGAAPNEGDRSGHDARGRREAAPPARAGGSHAQQRWGRLSVLLGVVVVALALTGRRAVRRLSAAAGVALARLRRERAKQSPAPRHAEASARPLSQMG